MKIELRVDHAEAEEFTAWLVTQGHDAVVGHTTKNVVGEDNEAENELFDALWSEYCNESNN